LKEGHALWTALVLLWSNGVSCRRHIEVARFRHWGLATQQSPHRPEQQIQKQRQKQLLRNPEHPHTPSAREPVQKADLIKSEVMLVSWRLRLTANPFWWAKFSCKMVPTCLTALPLSVFSFGVDKIRCEGAGLILKLWSR
jgi:hypothetical protein